MKCPNCNSKLRECHMYLHHVICDKCKYEEEDIHIINKGEAYDKIRSKQNKY